MLKVDKDTRTSFRMTSDVVLVSLLLTRDYFTRFSIVSIVDSEQVNVLLDAFCVRFVYLKSTEHTIEAKSLFELSI